MRVADGLYAFCLQGEQIAVYATTHTKNSVINSVGANWLTKLKVEKTKLQVWLKKYHLNVSKNGRGMSREFLIPKSIVQALNATSDANFAHTMNSFIARSLDAQRQDIHDPAIVEVAANLAELNGETAAALKPLLGTN